MKRLLIFIIIIILFFGGGALWWKANVSPVNSGSKESEIFVVKKGEGIRSIAKNLKDRGLIKNSIVFFLTVKKQGLDGKIQAGDHRLSPSMDTATIANNLTKGTLDIWITIPEGLRAEEITDILEKEVPSYKASWRQTLDTNEGYLFPDTYLIPKDADINLITSLLKNNFEAKYASLPTSTTKLSKTEIVTIASLVEREAKKDADRPLVASVILNRLNAGMGLNIDATLQYALGYDAAEKRWWRKGLSDSDKQIKSPYNTYRNVGLPPAPISNPGFPSLRAAINPADTEYIYYVSDKNGINHYAKTFAEHQQNIEKYLR